MSAPLVYHYTLRGRLRVVYDARVRDREPSLRELVHEWLRVGPRRLVLALPPAALVEPLAADVAGWLDDLDPDGTVGLHVIGGLPAPGRPRPDWRMDMHRPAVVIGPADHLVSRALNRGLGAHHDLWPIEFALLTNGAHWVVTEPALCPQSTVTLRRLVGFTARWPVAEPLRLTVRAGRTVPTRTTLTLPTLAAARALHASRDDTVLLHPYFRPDDRARALARVAGAADRFVVAVGASAAGPELSIVDEEDLVTWFDTDHDGSTVDRYVLDDGGEAQVAWAHWAPVDGSGRPAADVRAPDATTRCRAPLAEVRALAARVPVWRFDPTAEGWAVIDTARPGDLLLVAAHDGGYDPGTGIDAARTDPVPDCPTLAAEPSRTGLATGTGWLSLDRHSTDVREQARALLAAIDPALPAAARAAVVAAGYAHDAGKWHPTWQDALCALATDDERQRVAAGRPWAKSGIEGPLVFADSARFRHELASLLLLDGPLRGLLDGIEDADLVRYLVLAHHGKLRRRVDPAPLGVRAGRVTATPAMLGQPAGSLTEDETSLVDGTWTRTVDGLLARYGPFLLAYLETLVRMADWRASAGREATLA